MKQQFLVVIPARYASKRLPGKPLLEFDGRPLLQHVYQAAVNSKAAEVIIATDDARIARAAQGFDARVVMTSTSHQSGTERIAEAVTGLQLPAATLIVNVQGDELGLAPALIDQVAGNLVQHPDAAMASLYAPLRSAQELHNPNCVKVVTDARGYALTFSRAAIPWRAPDAPTPAPGYRHIGIYAYSCDFLETYTTLPVSALEQTERLEQLRALYHGYRIHLEQAAAAPGMEINTPEDVARATYLLR
ncbi:MAG: 3-deoxy-manno-octulosonate cytidylyltransferase [Gammaproteobacteria bacterium]|nr:3-deoxy-manno-octulosonate cytidylyltransferase [Gammaproteobacteria bacterium]MCY4282008.1 3-deoxy-manno-octulosonate cytidylyltransferase [Gammaproteobacteria bacterium]MCY4337217.1 3-deoxy-manno-octulosonate cytidylyltransferase [Gammaproteobacteria bacterium]